MPEIKHNFTGGKMNKDLDERLVPNGEYRDAMNVQVSTSEASDVGTVQNLLSNHKIYGNDFVVGEGKTCVGSIANEKDDAVYWFLNSSGVLDPSDIIMIDAFPDAPPSPIGPAYPGVALGFFAPLTTGDSIIEFKQDSLPQIQPVVIEASSGILSLSSSYQETQVNSAGNSYQQQYFTMPPGQGGFLLPGMQLVEVYVIDINSPIGGPPTIIQTLDFSGTSLISYTDIFGVSQNSNIPPQISGVNFGPNNNAFTLNFTPTDLINLLAANGTYDWATIGVLGFRFVSDPLMLDQNDNLPPLNFQDNTIITGINIVDDMLFWTDNHNEPKKINIPRCKAGTPLVTLPGGVDVYNYTKLINERRNISAFDDIPLQEKHVTVIKKPPSLAPVLDLKTGRDYSNIKLTPFAKVYTGVLTVTTDISPQEDDLGDNIATLDPYDFSGLNIGNVVTIRIDEDIYSNANFDLLWGTNLNDIIGTKVALKEFSEDNIDGPPIPITDYRIRAIITSVSSGFFPGIGLRYNGTDPIEINLEITSMAGFPPGPIDGGIRKYAIDLFDQQERLFEFKFPRFATRYKYDDGEYSTFSPFTEVAFVPGTFDYHPKKGYNLGMTNKLTEIEVKNFRLNDTPLDVVEIDILYKEDTSTNVYVVDTIKKDSTEAYWNDDTYKITRETIKGAVPSNQLLRPWDNVPKKALAQEVSGNRIIYGNYTQGWDVFDWLGNPFSPEFKWDIIEDGALGWKANQSSATKSIKSLREYQLGVVFLDQYGRETPVISNPTGTFKLDHKAAKENNRLRVGFKGVPPINQKYYKFYIKETSGEYYNMAMDRWWDADDGNVWLSFPSSDRNKLDIDTFLMLKKAAGEDKPVPPNRYKVLAIENEAPDFIKTKITRVVNLKHLEDLSGLQNIFAVNTMANNPQSGFREFEMEYQLFDKSSGSKLDEIDDGDLYISFAKAGSTASSDRYKIASITTDFDPLATAPVAAADAKYYVTLDKEPKEDIDFITNDPSGQNMQFIQSGTMVSIFKYKVENLPIFDGRFFVKIFKDESFREFIAGFLEEASTLEFRVRNTKRVYSMRTNHHVLHSHAATGHGLHPAEFTGDPATEGFSAYSHRFGWYASYFRLYNYGNDEMVSVGDGIKNYSTSKYRFHSPDNTGTVTVDTTSSPGQDHRSVSNVPWHDEWHRYTGWNGNPDSGPFGGPYASPGLSNTTSVSAQVALGYLNADRKADDLARNNEVWFIDMHQHVTNHVESTDVQTGTLNWYNMPYLHSQSNPALATPYGTTGSVVYPTTYHHFALTFGPIFMDDATVPSTPSFQYLYYPGGGCTKVPISYNGTPGTQFKHFFSIGNGNPHYNDANTVDMVENRLTVGSTWRWREDPAQTQYTIDQNPKERNIVRHYAGDDLHAGIAEQTAVAGLGTCNEDHFRAAQLSPNFNKTWSWIQKHETKQLDWVPVDITAGLQTAIGPIYGGLETTLTCISANHIGNNTSALGIEDFHIIVTETSYESATDQGGNSISVTPGYIIRKHGSTNLTGELFNADDGIDNPYLVVRDVEQQISGEYKIYLTGYIEALDLTHIIAPSGGDSVIFCQATMNGYSPNSAKRISIQKSTTGRGAYTNKNSTTNDSGCLAMTENLLYPVGYTMEFIEQYYDSEDLPQNPAIWETEPKDGPELDVYYEASGLIPLDINRTTSSGFMPLELELVGGNSIPIGSFQNCIIESDVGNFPDFYIAPDTQIIDSSGTHLQLFPAPWVTLPTLMFPYQQVHITKPDGTIFSAEIQSVPTLDTIEIESSTWVNWHSLNWHNCYSFGNGVESNRIRDNFNLPFISNGVKASSTLEEKIEREVRQYGLIFSGIYNSNSSINNLNQFIAAEKITKEINPIYGSIQKLHSRSTADGDLITLCEDRILKILATKDAVYNADGNPQLVASENVLGQTIPFVGEYGISKNPESFASESYRAYFTDKQRGAVMRLSQDGLTPISDHGMKDWFRDNLRLSQQLIGSYDEKKDEYNIALKPDHVVSFKEDIKGWVSFKSFVQMESGVSMASNYYTFFEGKIYQHHSRNPGGVSLFNTFYNIQGPSTVTVLLNDDPSTVKSFKTLAYEGSQARVTQVLNDNQYYNLEEVKGWYLSQINTDLEHGANIEFINKENKWFNYIKGSGELSTYGSLSLTNDPDDFSYQGIGEIIPSQIELIAFSTP